MEKDFNLQEYLEKMYNDTYFTEIVNEYNNNKRNEGFIDICKILNYREFFTAYAFIFKNKKIKKKLKKDKMLHLEEIDNECNCVKEILRVENPLDENSCLICIFTDPTKIDFDIMPVNTIQVTTLKQLYEEYFTSEENEGIVINPNDENIFVDKEYIQLILNEKYDEISEIVTLVDKIKNSESMDEIQNLLKEFLNDFDEQLEKN